MIRQLLLTAAAAGLLAPPGFAGDALPRVFYDDSERNLIVEHRKSGTTPAEKSAPADSSSQAPAQYTLRLDGIAATAAGTHVAWINGQRHADGSRLGALRVQVSRQGITLHGPGVPSRLIRVGESMVVNGSVP